MANNLASPTPMDFTQAGQHALARLSGTDERKKAARALYERLETHYQQWAIAGRPRRIDLSVICDIDKCEAELRGTRRDSAGDLAYSTAFVLGTKRATIYAEHFSDPAFRQALRHGRAELALETIAAEMREDTQGIFSMAINAWQDMAAHAARDGLEGLHLPEETVHKLATALEALHRLQKLDDNFNERYAGLQEQGLQALMHGSKEGGKPHCEALEKAQAFIQALQEAAETKVEAFYANVTKLRDALSLAGGISRVVMEAQDLENFKACIGIARTLGDLLPEKRWMDGNRAAALLHDLTQSSQRNSSGTRPGRTDWMEKVEASLAPPQPS